METLLLRDVGLCLTVAAGLALLFSTFGQPILIAYLATGVLLGPNGLHLVRDHASIELISEIGLLLLMFILGQEINIARLARAGRVVAVSGVLQFLLCFACGWLLFGFVEIPGPGGRFDRAYLAYAFSLSSTMVVVKTLADRFDLDTLVSRITVGVLVIQDLWAISFLSLQPSFVDPRPMDLLWSFTKGVVLVCGVFGAAKFVLPIVFRRITNQPEMVLLAAMGWCFAVTGFSDVLGLSREMGALLAGIAIATFPFHVDVAAKISSLRDFFVTLFFVGLGLQMPIPSQELIQAALIVSVFLVLSRIVTVFPVLHAMKLGVRTALIPAINLGQLSEFAPVMLSLGVALGHVSRDTLSLALMVLVLTMALSSYTIVYAHEISGWLGGAARWMGFKDLSSVKDTGDIATSYRVMLLGFFRDASSLLYEWFENESPEFRKQVLVVDFNPIAHQRLKSASVACIYGDVGNADIFARYDLSATELVVCSIPDHVLRGTSNARLLRTLRARMPKVRLVMTAETLEQARELYELGADYVYLPRIIGARGLLSALELLLAGEEQRLKHAHIEELRVREEILP